VSYASFACPVCSKVAQSCEHELAKISNDECWYVEYEDNTTRVIVDYWGVNRSGCACWNSFVLITIDGIVPLTKEQVDKYMLLQ
jgi:hypothetical protein